MRGSCGAPAATAKRLACPPAQKTAWLAATSAPSRRTAPFSRATPVTARPRISSPPAPRTSSAIARATAAKSTIPVLGECRPAMPAQWGSSSVISSAAQPSQARDRVGLATALELVQARQLALVQRDDHLAAALHRDAALLAVRVQAGGPSTQSRAFSDPGL